MARIQSHISQVRCLNDMTCGSLPDPKLNHFIQDTKIPRRILQRQFKVKSALFWDSEDIRFIRVLKSGHYITLLRQNMGCIKHSPFLVPVYKCFSSLVSDFYCIALSLFPCGYGKSTSAPNYPTLFHWQAPFTVVYCVCGGREMNMPEPTYVLIRNCPIMAIML